MWTDFVGIFTKIGHLPYKVFWLLRGESLNEEISYAIQRRFPVNLGKARARIRKVFPNVRYALKGN